MLVDFPQFHLDILTVISGLAALLFCLQLRLRGYIVTGVRLSTQLYSTTVGMRNYPAPECFSMCCSKLATVYFIALNRMNRECVDGSLQNILVAVFHDLMRCLVRMIASL